MLDKLDKIWIGLLMGLLIPLFSFFSYWLFLHSQLNFPYGFIRYLRGANTFQDIAIICVTVNLLVFYLFLNKKVYDLSKGIMFATFAYVGIVFYISLL
ncbi:MAG: hypothetical protein KA210_07245 [Bacteroidia bacterium]|jgi:hypothetical protein|nr:hypothetical protein [Bacteroidia bacterium]